MGALGRAAAVAEKYNRLLTLNPDEQSVVFPNAPKGILFPGDPGVPNDDFADAVHERGTARGAGEVAGGMLDGSTVVRGGLWGVLQRVRRVVGGITSGNPPYGFTDTSAAPTLFNEPFVTAATGVSVGQRFPLQRWRMELAGESHTSVNWANFEPLTGIPAFAMNNVTPYAENYSVSVERQVGAHTVVSAG